MGKRLRDVAWPDCIFDLRPNMFTRYFIIDLSSLSAYKETQQSLLISPVIMFDVRHYTCLVFVTWLHSLWLISLIKLIYCWGSIVGIVKRMRLIFLLPSLNTFHSSSSPPIRRMQSCLHGPMKKLHHSSGPSWHFNWRGINQAPLSRRGVIISSCLSSHQQSSPPLPHFTFSFCQTLSLNT